jgi:signal transduction histidine kinase
VTDQGIGVAPAERERIFAKYFRGSNVNGTTAGLGMGLYVARNLASRLRGLLTVESACGRGSTFTLTLPWSCVDTPVLAMAPGGGAHGHASAR